MRCSKIKVPIYQFIHQTRILIENSLSDPKMMAKLANFGYTEAKITDLQNLRAECESLQSSQIKERAYQMAATSELNTLWDQADKTYMNTLKVARVAFRGTVKPIQEILLSGPRRRSFTGWME